MTTETIRSGDIAIRPMRDEDGDYALLMKWLSDEKVAEFYGGRDTPRTLESVRELYRPRITDEVTVTPCIIEHASSPIGYIQFYETKSNLRQDIDPLLNEPHAFGIDMFIGEHSHWGKGIGSSAARLLTDHLFSSHGATTIIADPAVHNERGIRTYEKAGFEKVRVFPGYEPHEGKLHDWWLMVRRK